MFGDALFEHTRIQTEEDNEKAIKEAMVWEELAMAMPIKEEFEQFLESDVAKAMFDKGIITEANSVVVLSKLDDLSRRTKSAAIYLAQQKNDPLWKQWKKHKEKEKSLEEKMEAKYGTLASRAAVKAQKEYIKEVPNAFRRRVTIAPLKKA
jgi:hypothetical protein